VNLRLKLRSLLFLITPSFHVGPHDTGTLYTQRRLSASGKECYLLLQLVHNELHSSIHPVVLQSYLEQMNCNVLGYVTECIVVCCALLVVVMFVGSLHFFLNSFSVLVRNFFFQPESDGSRSGSSLSLRNIPPAVTQGNAQSPSHSHRGVHRSISATNAKPSRRASSGGETLRESQQQQQGTATGGGLSFHMFMECSVTPSPLPDAFVVVLCIVQYLF